MLFLLLAAAFFDSLGGKESHLNFPASIPSILRKGNFFSLKGFA
jgi:hypothetical protein